MTRKMNIRVACRKKNVYNAEFRPSSSRTTTNASRIPILAANACTDYEKIVRIVLLFDLQQTRVIRAKESLLEIRFPDIRLI